MSRTLDAATLVRPARFAHAVLRTRHLDEAVSWYETVLGMQVVHRNDFLAFLTYDEEHHRLALIATGQEQPAPPGAAGLDHLAYSFLTLGELLGSYRRLQAKGILPVWSINHGPVWSINHGPVWNINHGPTPSLYYADPDGNRLKLQIDNFASEAELERWMQTGAFEKNPIGVDFDPEKLAARFENGDPIHERIQQGATA